MCDGRKVLLATIFFTALYSVAAEETKLLDMAPDAVDYLYNKCRDVAMKKFINSGLLRHELNLSKGFQKAWNDNTQCQKLIPGGIKEHTTALLAYNNGDRDFIKTFNNDVETMGVNLSTYQNHFNFKSLHFLLMDYMMLQKPKNCKTVYSLVETRYKAQKGSKVRLGRFTTAEANFDMIKRFEDLDGAIILNITSCFFVKLGDNICKMATDSVLLSPAEEFIVESVTEVSEDDNYTVIVLKHFDLKSSHSNHICSRAPAAVSTQWLVLVLAAFSVFFLMRISE